MARRVVTIDIDSRSIRILQVRNNRVERWASSPLEPGVMSDGTVADVEALADQVRRLRRSSGISGGDMVASVTGMFSVARTLTLAPEDQDQIVTRAQEAVPGEELRLMWQTVRVKSSGVDVLVIGASEDQVDTQTEVLRAAGMPPKAMELKTLALARVVNGYDCIIINMEPTTLDVMLLIDRVPRVMRTIALPEVASDEERAGHVASAVEQTLTYYNAHHDRETKPEDLPLILVGGLAEDQPLRQMIEDRVDHPVERLAPTLDVPSHLPVAEYAVNMGLALRQAPQPEPTEDEPEPVSLRINLVPQRPSPFRLTPQRVGFLAGIAAGLAVAAALWQLNVTTADQITDIKAGIRAIDREMGELREDLSTLTQLEASIKDFSKLTEPWGRVTAARTAIEEILTEGITLTDVNVAGGNAQFSTISDTVDQAILFVEALRADGRFGDVPYDSPLPKVGATLDLALLKAE